MAKLDGPALRELRRSRGLSLVALSVKAGVSERAIRDLETGATEDPQPGTVQALAGALGVQPQVLFQSVSIRPLATLVVFDPSGRPIERQSIHAESVRIGRTNDHDVVLPDGRVSSPHAQITFAGRDMELRDLGSRNGTFLEGKQIERAVLAFGNLIAIGPFALRLYDPSTPREDLPIPQTVQT